MNRTFLTTVAVFLIVGGTVYFGFREFSQINNQLASLQEQLTPFFEKSIVVVPEEPIISVTSTDTSMATTTATTTVSEEPSPAPEEEIDICESLDCNIKDAWIDSGSSFTCQSTDGKTCSCQTQTYFDYSCSTAKQKCVYSTTKTRTVKDNCVALAYPDLIFQSPGFSPSLPIADDQMFFWATLKNQGTAAAASSLSNFKIDGQKIDESSSVSLAGGSSIVVAWPIGWKAVAGSHELEVCADAGLLVAESNEANNCSKTTFTVSEGSTAILPDLIIESINVSPYPLLADQLVSFSATVKNQGKAPARASVTVSRLDVGNDRSWDYETWGAVTAKQLAVGSNDTVFWRNKWMSVSGRHKIEICADAVSESELRIAEIRENNNCISEILVVP